MAKKRRQEADPIIEEEVVNSDDDDDEILDDGDDVMSSEEDGDAALLPSSTPASHPPITSDGRYHNKQRLLLLSSRGITARYRHLLEDLRTLIPHSKKESKLDVGKNYSGGGYGAAVNEIAEVRGCQSVLFLECRERGMGGYLWLGRASYANTVGGDG